MRDRDDEFAYLVDVSDRALAEELLYAVEHGLTELAKACKREARSRGKADDFWPRFFGNVGPMPEDEDEEDGER